jgi:ABC-2 type transport system permease protein
MNIFWQELKYYRQSAIIWILSLSLGVLLFLSIYTSLASQIDVFKEVISHYPHALLAAINFQFEVFYTIDGYFGYLLTFIWIAGAIQAMNYATSVISKEVSGKTADFLLSKPVSRSRMLTEKFAAVLVLILITNVFFTSAALLSAKLFSSGSFSIKAFILLSASLFFVQLFFLALGFLFGSVLPKIKTVISVTLPTVFALFIIASFGGVLDKPQFYYITPFKYFNSIYIIQHNSYEYKYLWVLSIFVIFCLVTSYVVYNRRDINL